LKLEIAHSSTIYIAIKGLIRRIYETIFDYY